MNVRKVKDWAISSQASKCYCEVIHDEGSTTIPKGSRHGLINHCRKGRMLLKEIE